MGTQVTGLISAAVTITTAGTRVPLSATSVLCSRLVIRTPASGNTGLVYVGGSNVSSSNGYQLPAGGGTGGTVEFDSVMLGHAGEEIDLSQVYLDADTNGNSVRILYDKKYSS